MRMLLFCLTLMLANFVGAQNISEEMRTDIRNFLDITGALKFGDQMGNSISQQIINAMRTQNPNVPPAATDVIVEVVRGHINEFANSEEAIEGLIAIYAKYYSHEDILALTEFYSTPLGLKMISISGPIALESAQFGQSLFLQRVPQIQQDIQDRLKAAGLIQQPPAQQ